MTVTLSIKQRAKDATRGSLTEVIPGIVYGPKQAPIAIEVGRKEFEKLFKTAGESTVIELTGLDTSINTLVKEVSFSPLKGGIVHVDFYAIEKGKDVVTHVPLHFIGEAPAAKLGAMINKVLHEVTVSCQPAALPAHLDVDLGVLVTLENKIMVADITVPKGVTIMTDAHEVVALVETITEEVETVPVVDIADIPVETKGKTSDAE
jgi:large subunit ribosomal protein L25